MVRLAASYSVIDSHTAGHPTRVILSGLPPLPGRSVAEKRDAFRAAHDHLRASLLHEPAGHAAMVGLVPVASEVAEFGAFFISSYIYLDMCGHGAIGYAKTLAATGAIAAPRESFTLETPAGVVTVGLNWDADGELRGVRIRNVPCRVGIAEATVDVPGFGAVAAGIVYGGMWYAIVDAQKAGVALSAENVTQGLAAGSAIKKALTAFLADAPAVQGGGSAPSVLFYRRESRLRAQHMLVLAPNKFDRSPCGTGTSARLALMAHQGEIADGETYHAENLLGAAFTARIAERRATPMGQEIVPEIGGQAHIMSFATIVKEHGDPLAAGFLCQ